MVAGEPFYRDLFRFSGRRCRGSFINLTLVVIFSAILVATVGSFFAPIGIILIWLYVVPVSVIYNIAGAQRCRDFGWSGWAVLLNYVPVLGVAFWLVLLFYPGTHGPNRYGPDPRDAYSSA